MVMRILNQKVISAIDYWIFISIYFMGPANYGVEKKFSQIRRNIRQNLIPLKTNKKYVALE